MIRFLDYLKSWKGSTETRPGDFTQNAKARMFLSWQTHEGFEITVHSAIEANKFLLQESMEYVRASVRTRWRGILGTSGNWEGGVTTQIYVNLDTTATPSESKDQYHAKVGTQGEERTGKEHGNKLLMISCHAERS